MKLFPSIVTIASAVMAVLAADPPALTKQFTMNVNLLESLPPITITGGMTVGKPT
jgi:hypothetical protein